MNRNVWKWNNDLYDDNNNIAQHNLKGLFSISARVFRGDSWYCNALADYSSDSPRIRSSIFGFHLAYSSK